MRINGRETMKGWWRSRICSGLNEPMVAAGQRARHAALTARFAAVYLHMFSPAPHQSLKLSYQAIRKMLE
jgi:hypothetical protein